MLEYLISVQAGIHRAIGTDIEMFATTRDWWTLLAVLPLGTLFGAVHALTPGHSKLVLATYVVGDRMKMVKAASVAATLAATHIGSAIVIALVAGFLLSRTITDAGQAPLLANLSHWLLVAIGLWMVAHAFWDRPHVHGVRFAFGLIAGLVPCPLTLFIMVLAVSRGVPEAGLTFAAAMLIGVGAVLIVTALIATGLGHLLENGMIRHGNTLAIASRSLEIVAGIALTAIALAGLAG